VSQDIEFTTGVAVADSSGPVAIGNGNGAASYVDQIAVTRDHRSTALSLADVRWIESSGNYIVLHTASDRHVVRGTLAAIEAQLDPRRFTRIHRRLIVALDQIRELQPWLGGDQIMYLHDGSKLRVSRTHRAALDRAMHSA